MDTGGENLVSALRLALADERQMALQLLHRAAALLLGESRGQACLDEVAALIPSAFLFPESTVARIRVGNVTHGSDPLPDDAVRIAVRFRESGGREGCIEVACRETDAAGRPEFLEEERDLLDSLARLIEAGLRRAEGEGGHVTSPLLGGAGGSDSSSRLPPSMNAVATPTRGAGDRDLAGIREFETALKEMADTVAMHTGEAHNTELVKFLSSHFGIDIAMVGLLDESGLNVRTLAMAENGRLQENMTYPLAGSPCANVVREDSCLHEDGVRELYPDDEWFRIVKARGYAGVRLRDGAGKTIGLVSAVSRQPLMNVRGIESFFKLAAARVSAEIDRLQKMAAVQESRLRYSLAESGTADGLWDLDMLTGAVYYSPRVGELLGMPVAALGSDPEVLWARLHPDDALKTREASHDHVQHDRPFDVQYRLRHADGSYRWFRTRGKALRDDNDTPIRFTGSITDISDGKRHQLQLKAENAWLAGFAEGVPLPELLALIADTARDLFENAGLHMWLQDGQAALRVFPESGGSAFSESRLVALLESLPAEGATLTPASPEWPFLQEDFAYHRMRVLSVSADGISQRVGIAVSWPDAIQEQPHERHFMEAAARLVGLALDRLRKETELERQRMLFENLFESAPEAMVVLDRDDRVLNANSGFSRLFQYAVDEVRGAKLNDLIVPPEFLHEGNRLSERAMHGTDVMAESFRRRKDGMLLPVSILGAPVTVPGTEARCFAIYRDQRRLHEAAKRIDHQLRHDQLTGLPNRYEFERRLQQAMKLSAEGAGRTGVVYFDLDQFKVVNDTAGHMHGDDLLKEVTRRLQPLVSSSGVLARLGGDEFVALLVNCTREQCEDLARRMRDALAAESFRLGERTFVISASFGVVAMQASAGEDANDLLGLADSTCFLAKERGRNRIQVYDPDNTDIAQRREELDWVSRLNEALAEDRFRLYYQRIEAVAGTDPVQHYEILLRMTDRNGENVPPGAFIPPAERYNLMPRIDRWVLENVVARFSRLDRKEQESTLLAVNISGNTLSDEGLPEFVTRLFEQHAVPPASFCFEITETAAIGNFDDALVFIATVRGLGCRVSLDDFGSGLSSFRYLKQIAPDFLKIDGSFVREISRSQTDFSMVEAINRIGKTVGIRTIAEFVEDEQILAALARIGVDYAQGYCLHRPEPWSLPLDVDIPCA